jgi:hypothetical protein
VPVVWHARTRALRTEITDVADPAHQQVTYLQLELLTEALGAGGFVLTWDSSYAALFHKAQESQREILSTLLPLASRLPDPIPQRADDVSRVLTQADPIVDDLIAGRISIGRVRQSPPRRGDPVHARQLVPGAPLPGDRRLRRSAA